MARLTVEDCEKFVPNRFNLVILAATRSREILGGAPVSVERNRDKVSVLSLREIAGESIELEVIKELAIQRFQNPRYLAEFHKENHVEQTADDLDASSEISEMIPDSDAESFAALEQDSLEGGFDSVTEILDDGFSEDISTP